MSAGRVHCQGLHVCVCVSVHVCPGAVFMNVHLRRGCFRCHGKFLRSFHSVSPTAGCLWGGRVQEAPCFIASQAAPPPPLTMPGQNKEPLCLCALRSIIYFSQVAYVSSACTDTYHKKKRLYVLKNGLFSDIHQSYR